MTRTAHTAQFVLKRIVETGSGKKSLTSHPLTTPLRSPTQRLPSSTPIPDVQRSLQRGAAPALQLEFIFTVHHIINTVRPSPVESENSRTY